MEGAGASHSDVDFIELQDNTVYYELCFPEEWGFWDAGQAEHELEAGNTTPIGSLPINPSGGFLSFGEATTAQGIFQICELATQLRGAGGGRQVPDAKVGLGQTLGLGGNAAAVVLKR
jgi:acetyl-CoA acetyltransferase